MKNRRDAGTDSLVRCHKCQREERVSFGCCLRNGWPKCHRETMHLVSTDADVYRTTLGVLRGQSA